MEFETKVTCVFLLVIVLSYSTFDFVHGKSYTSTAIENIEPANTGPTDDSVNNNNSPRIARQSRCSTRYGCHEGFCWAGCTVAGRGGWCYTTEAYSPPNTYLPCVSKKDGKCTNCLKCANSCKSFGRKG